MSYPNIFTYLYGFTLCILGLINYMPIITSYNYIVSNNRVFSYNYFIPTKNLNIFIHKARIQY